MPTVSVRSIVVCLSFFQFSYGMQPSQGLYSLLREISSAALLAPSDRTREKRIELREQVGKWGGDINQLLMSVTKPGRLRILKDLGATLQQRDAQNRTLLHAFTEEFSKISSKGSAGTSAQCSSLGYIIQEYVELEGIGTLDLPDGGNMTPCTVLYSCRKGRLLLQELYREQILTEEERVKDELERLLQLWD